MCNDCGRHVQGLCYVLHWFGKALLGCDVWCCDLFGGLVKAFGMACVRHMHGVRKALLSVV